MYNVHVCTCMIDSMYTFMHVYEYMYFITHDPDEINEIFD